MSKSIYELALHYSGQAGSYHAAVTSLLADQSEFNVKYWTKLVAQLEAEHKSFDGSEVASEEEMPEVKLSTYYPVLD